MRITNCHSQPPLRLPRGCRCARRHGFASGPSWPQQLWRFTAEAASSQLRCAALTCKRTKDGRPWRSPGDRATGLVGMGPGGQGARESSVGSVTGVMVNSMATSSWDWWISWWTVLWFWDGPEVDQWWKGSQSTLVNSNINCWLLKLTCRKSGKFASFSDG